MDNAGFWSVVLVERSRHLYTASCLSLFRTGVFQRERERAIEGNGGRSGERRVILYDSIN